VQAAAFYARCRMGSQPSSRQSIASHATALPAEITPHVASTCNTRFAIFTECPQCGHALHPEHAHYKCAGCGWRDSCCD